MMYKIDEKDECPGKLFRERTKENSPYTIKIIVRSRYRILIMRFHSQFIEWVNGYPNLNYKLVNRLNPIFIIF